MSTTFDFGNGPVPAHQHPNGGGWVADTATVADRVYVGPLARVVGGTIRGGTIRGGTILGGTIVDGTIEGGTIWGGTIRGGTIRGDRDLLVIGPVGSENQQVTLVRNGDGHLLGVGCWHGHTVDELANEVQRRCGNRPELVAEYAAVEVLLRMRLAEWGQA